MKVNDISKAVSGGEIMSEIAEAKQICFGSFRDTFQFYDEANIGKVQRSTWQLILLTENQHLKQRTCASNRRLFSNSETV